MRKWIYAGTFDPITNGHLDVIQRAAPQVDELIVGIVDSPNHKAKGLLSLEERTNLAKESTKHIKGVVVKPFSGMLVEFAKQVGACGLVRGLRTASDYDYELSICHLNRMLNPDIETFYIFADPQWSFCSSSAVRELCALKADTSKLAPPVVAQFLKTKS